MVEKMFDFASEGQTEWGPLREGEGASFGTHKLVEVNPVRVEFRKTLRLQLFYLLFFLGGAALSGILLVVIVKENEKLLFLPVVAGIVLAIVGLVKLLQKRRAIFDRVTATFWKEDGTGTEISLDQIRALQILSKTVTQRAHRFRSHELNLVLKDGGRVNVVDHGNISMLREDAAKLSKFLGVPLWDTGDKKGSFSFGLWSICGKGY